jgi:hypothetical protein
MTPTKRKLLPFSCITVRASFGQEKFTLSGTIIANSNETLIGVNVVIPELKTGVTTNEYGFTPLRYQKEIIPFK